MELRQWVNGLRSLSCEQIIHMHFNLQEKIKHHYRLRSEGNNFERAVQLCEQMVALAEFALPALLAAHNLRASEYKEITGKDCPFEFYPPSHYGYRQLITIMRKQKNAKRVKELEEKRDREGWRG